ncbi:MAG: hypothetical protein CR993_04910 [Rhodobacterales bacterium]|nr:MAG: hypothetical protein CR993_04910 [Rhodobacterales bacterium]
METNYIERIREGRIAALQSLRFHVRRQAEVVTIQTRTAPPTFHSVRKPEPLLLTERVAA